VTLFRQLIFFSA